MFPPALFTVSTPSATIHFAGDLSRFETHSSKFVPSNRMIASDGGAMQVAAGVTTFGMGSQTSVSSGFGAAGGAAWGEAGDCARTGAATTIRATSATNFENSMCIIRRKYTELYRRGQGKHSFRGGVDRVSSGAKA